MDTPDEPIFAKHLLNVLTDLEAGQLDGIEEAYEAIMNHPTLVEAFSLRRIEPLNLGPSVGTRPSE